MKKLLFAFFSILTFTSTGQTLELFSKDFLYGYRDKATKKVIIHPTFTYAIDFIDGIAAVSTTPQNSPNINIDPKWKIIDNKGNYILADTLEFDKVEIKNKNFIIVYIKTDNNIRGKIEFGDSYNIGVLKKNGSFLIPCDYELISDLSEGFFAFTQRNKGILVANITGEIAIPLQDKFNISEYVGCGLFQYINSNERNNDRYFDPFNGGLIDKNLKVWLNQDSVNFVPSKIINRSNNADKTTLFGLTTTGKASKPGIYRVGFGLVVPKYTYNFKGGDVKYKITPNLIIITDESFNNRFSKDKTIAKYDWSGNLIWNKNN